MENAQKENQQENNQKTEDKKLIEEFIALLDKTLNTNKNNLD